MKTSLITTVFLFAFSFSGQAATLSLDNCAAIEDPVERLACYDTLAGRLPADTENTNDAAQSAADSAVSRGDVSASKDTAVMTSTPIAVLTPDAEAAFGLTNKQKPKEEQLDEIQLKWTTKTQDDFGKWIITLENGQVWHQIDSRRFSFVNSEQLVVIYRGALGSFFLGEPERRNGIRVKRIK